MRAWVRRLEREQARLATALEALVRERDEAVWIVGLFQDRAGKEAAFDQDGWREVVQPVFEGVLHGVDGTGAEEVGCGRDALQTPAADSTYGSVQDSPVSSRKGSMTSTLGGSPSSVRAAERPPGTPDEACGEDDGEDADEGGREYMVDCISPDAVDTLQTVAEGYTSWLLRRTHPVVSDLDAI